MSNVFQRNRRHKRLNRPLPVGEGWGEVQSIPRKSAAPTTTALNPATRIDIPSANGTRLQITEAGQCVPVVHRLEATKRIPLVIFIGCESTYVTYNGILSALGRGLCPI